MIKYEIKRPNGKIEIVEERQRVSIDKDLFYRMREATQAAGRGYIIKAIITTSKNNLKQLQRQYNDLHNEGGEGYIPDYKYFINLPAYKEWTETEEII
jgi:hypothetical protein